MSIWRQYFFSTANSGSIEIPRTARRIIVDAWGAGGGGTVSTSAEGGGGGGAFARVTREVSGGEIIYYQVGDGGIPGANGGNTIASFNSDLSSPFLRAEGGKSTVGQTGGAGGSASASIGDITKSGGNGASGQGGGGARAGSSGGGSANPSFPGLSGFQGTGIQQGNGLVTQAFDYLNDFTFFPNLTQSQLGFTGPNVGCAIVSSNTHIAILSHNPLLTGSNLSISSDGTNWTSYRLPVTDRPYGLNFANNEFVVETEGVNMRHHRINPSVGTWTTGTNPTVSGLQLFRQTHGMIYIPESKYYITLGESPGQNGLFRSNTLTDAPVNVFSSISNTDIIIFNQLNTKAIAYNANTICIAVSFGAINELDIIYSTNGGFSFSRASVNPDASGGWRGMAFNKKDNKFYALYQGNYFDSLTRNQLTLFSSSNGVSWTTQTFIMDESNIFYPKVGGNIRTPDEYIDVNAFAGGFDITPDGIFLLGGMTRNDDRILKLTLMSRDGINWVHVPIPKWIAMSDYFNGKYYIPIFQPQLNHFFDYISVATATPIEGSATSYFNSSSNSDISFVKVVDFLNSDINYTAIPIYNSILGTGGTGGVPGSFAPSGDNVFGNEYSLALNFGPGGGGGGGSNDTGANAGTGGRGLLVIYYTEARKMTIT